VVTHSYLSLSRHILRNYVFVYAIQNHLPLPIGKNISQNLDEYLEDSDTDNEVNTENHLRLILKEETYIKKQQNYMLSFRVIAIRNVLNGLEVNCLQQHFKRN
jgi:hypothetical protein